MGIATFLEQGQKALLAAITPSRDTQTNRAVYVPVTALLGADGINVASGTNPVPATPSGTSTIYHLPSAGGSTNATNLKASAAILYSLVVLNAATSTRYLKLYNVAGTPNVGTDVPVFTIAIPGNGGIVLDRFNSLSPFTVGLGFATTVNPADNDAAAITAGDFIGLNIEYV